MVAYVLAVAAGACAAASCGFLPFALGADGPVVPVGRFGELAERLHASEVVEAFREKEGVAARERECLDQMPAMIDAVTLGLSAGLSFDSSLGLYCARDDGALSRLLSRAMLSWQIGECGREEALLRAAGDAGVEVLADFGSTVCESLAFGSPLAAALERQAQLIREEERSRVEEEIERVPVKMLIPLGTLIVPAMLLAILGPLLGSALVLR